MVRKIKATKSFAKVDKTKATKSFAEVEVEADKIILEVFKRMTHSTGSTMDEALTNIIETNFGEGPTPSVDEVIRLVMNLVSQPRVNA